MASVETFSITGKTDIFLVIPKGGILIAESKSMGAGIQGASAHLIGILMGLYGAIGLGQAYFGRLSDRIQTRIGKRRPFLLVGNLLVLGALAILTAVGGLTIKDKLIATAAALFVLFFGLQLLAPALYALSLPDLFPSEHMQQYFGALDNHRRLEHYL